jgi:hypothetical protein
MPSDGAHQTPGQTNTRRNDTASQTGYREQQPLLCREKSRNAGESQSLCVWVLIMTNQQATPHHSRLPRRACGRHPPRPRPPRQVRSSSRGAAAIAAPAYCPPPAPGHHSRRRGSHSKSTKYANGVCSGNHYASVVATARDTGSTAQNQSKAHGSRRGWSGRRGAREGAPGRRRGCRSSCQHARTHARRSTGHELAVPPGTTRTQSSEARGGGRRVWGGWGGWGGRTWQEVPACGSPAGSCWPPAALAAHTAQLTRTRGAHPRAEGLIDGMACGGRRVTRQCWQREEGRAPARARGSRQTTADAWVADWQEGAPVSGVCDGPVCLVGSVGLRSVMPRLRPGRGLKAAPSVTGTSSRGLATRAYASSQAGSQATQPAQHAGSKGVATLQICDAQHLIDPDFQQGCSHPRPAERSAALQYHCGSSRPTIRARRRQ